MSSRVLSPGASDRLRRVGIAFATLAALGLFLGVAGPFGSYLNGPWWQRVAYWTGLLLLGGLVFGTAAKIILGKCMAPKATVAWLAAASLLLSVPFAAAVSLLAVGLWPALSRLSAIDWYAQVAAIAVPLTLTLGLGRKALHVRQVDRRAPKPANEPSFDVVPRTVLCLQMEDHYVRVHTMDGSRLVLCTFQQAIATLGGLPGLQVHRSWWVADAAVVEVLTEGRNMRVQLSNGLTAPIARSSVAAVRQAGWLAREAPDRRAAVSPI